MKKATLLSSLNIPLDRDILLRSLIRELAGVLEDVVGYTEASGYVSLVGQNIGEWINDIYRKEMGVSSLSREQVAEVLVDLKCRIQGDFSVVSQDDSRIVLDNSVCPFEEKVIDRPSMCMMTSNVFGFIAAENLGYAKVVIEQTLAKRDEKCKVILYLKPSPEAEAAEGREYFKAADNILLRFEPNVAASNRFIALNKTFEELRASHHKLLAQAEVLKNEIIERKQAEEASRDSHERFLTILDSLDAIVYVADMKTYEIIFVNKYVSDLFGDIEGKICWQTLQADQTSPCDFCTNNKIVDAGGNPTSPYAWEFRNTKTDRWYYIIDRALNWVDGRVVRLEIATDITDQKQMEEMLRASLRLSEYALTHSLDELLTKTLDEAEALTGSTIGFFHFLEADQKTLWLQAWSTNTLKNMCTAEGKGTHYSLDKGGVWVDAVRQRRPLIHNDYASLPNRKGLPPGHAQVIRELVVPIIRGKLIAGILGVGNKPGAYDEKDVEIVSRLGNLAWDILQAKCAEEDLAKYREHLEELVKERTAEVEKKNAELARMNKLFVGRELRMIELKEKIKNLEGQVASSKGQG